MSETKRPTEYFRHVLVVDDDYELTDLLCEVLTYENCVADVAANGMEALDKLRSNHYEAIICDLMMPRIDGEALHKEVVKLYPYLADKFLFITGQAARSSGLADYVVGTGNALLGKPFEMGEFRAALQELLQRH